MQEFYYINNNGKQEVTYIGRPQSGNYKSYVAVLPPYSRDKFAHIPMKETIYSERGKGYSREATAFAIGRTLEAGFPGVTAVFGIRYEQDEKTGIFKFIDDNPHVPGGHASWRSTMGISRVSYMTEEGNSEKTDVPIIHVPVQVRFNFGNNFGGGQIINITFASIPNTFNQGPYDYLESKEDLEKVLNNFDEGLYGNGVGIDEMVGIVRPLESSGLYNYIKSALG